MRSRHVVGLSTGRDSNASTLLLERTWIMKLLDNHKTAMKVSCEKSCRSTVSVKQYLFFYKVLKELHDKLVNVLQASKESNAMSVK